LNSLRIADCHLTFCSTSDHKCNERISGVQLSPRLLGQIQPRPARETGGYPSTSTIISISTGMPEGSVAMPTAERACLLASPYRWIKRSEAPFATLGVSSKSALAGQHFPGHQHLGMLKHQPPGVAYQPSSGFDQPGLNTGQRRVLHLLRQRQPAHQVAQFVGQATTASPGWPRTGAVLTAEEQSLPHADWYHLRFQEVLEKGGRAIELASCVDDTPAEVLSSLNWNSRPMTDVMVNA